jgi:hypothetical protein
MTAVAAQPKHPLIAGEPIKGRAIQQLLWGVALGTVVFGFLASGLYFGISQVHWYIHIGSFYWPGFWLKDGWDSGMGVIHPHSWLINTVNWDDYRHAYRNIGLPAFAVMGALSITGGSKKMASRWYTALAPLLVLATAVVLITAGVWVTLWANAKFGPASHAVTALEAIALGFIIGRVLHTIWKPAGTRIQHFLVERAVDRYFRRGGTGLPFFVRQPVAPPTFREAGATLVAEDEKSGEAADLRAEGRTRRSDAIYYFVALAVLVVLAVDFVGFVGHILAGVLHVSFPYLAP